MNFASMHSLLQPAICSSLLLDCRAVARGCALTVACVSAGFCVSAVTVSAVTVSASAQNQAGNPFGGAGGAVQEPGAAAPTSNPSTVDTDFGIVDPNQSNRDLIIRSIADSNPREPKRLVVAINTLLNLEEDAEAKKYVAVLSEVLKDASDAQFFTLHRDVGTPFFIDLASKDTLQPEGRPLAEKVLDAAWRYNYNPQRLDSLTKQLDHENIYVRTDALSQLKSAGEPGAAAIINALDDAGRAKQFPFLRTALTQFDANAANPLIGAVLSDNPTIKLEASQLLGFIDRHDARMALYHPFVSGETERIREVAGKSLKQHLGYTPSQHEIENSLYKAARDFGASTPIDPFEPETFVTVWRWDQGLAPERVRTDVAKQLKAARFAEALLFARPTETRYQQLYLVSALQAMKSAGGVDQPLDPAFVDSLLRRFSADQVCLALENALYRKLPAAAIAASELLEQYNDDRVLRSTAGRPCSLVQALQFGDQRVLYAAAKTISSLSLQQPFAGSSQYLKSLVYLATSLGNRKVLVGHNDPAIARSIADSVSRSGYDAATEISARRLFKLATTDPDIEMILVSSTISRPDYLELVQMLRRDWRSRLIPIGISHQPLDRPRIESYLRNDPLTMGLPVTGDAGIIARQLSNLRLRGGLDLLRSDIRLMHARWASDQLAALTERETAAVKYDFAAHQEMFARGLYNPETSLASSRVLARVGTPFAQKQLVSAASQPGLPPEARRAAVASLGKAFQENGILLTRAEILKQYEIYNSSTSTDDESREILGSILDLLEKKAGAASDR